MPHLYSRMGTSGSNCPPGLPELPALPIGNNIFFVWLISLRSTPCTQHRKTRPFRAQRFMVIRGTAIATIPMHPIAHPDNGAPRKGGHLVAESRPRTSSSLDQDPRLLKTKVPKTKAPGPLKHLQDLPRPPKSSSRCRCSSRYRCR